MKMLVSIYVDASCDNNSKYKFMGIGIAVFINDIRAEQYDVSEMLGTNGTNNIAEWGAFLKGTEVAHSLSQEYPDASIRIYGDSQLVVKQLYGEYRIKNDIFLGYYTSCKQISSEIQNFKGYFWIPRTKNREADVLSTTCVKEFIKENFKE